MVTTHDDQYLAVGRNLFGSCGMENFKSPLETLTKIKYFKNKNIKIQKIFTAPHSENAFYLTHHEQIYVNGCNGNDQCGVTHKHNKNVNV